MLASLLLNNTSLETQLWPWCFLVSQFICTYLLVAFLSTPKNQEKNKIRSKKDIYWGFRLRTASDMLDPFSIVWESASCPGLRLAESNPTGQQYTQHRSLLEPALSLHSWQTGMLETCILKLILVSFCQPAPIKCWLLQRIMNNCTLVLQLLSSPFSLHPL